MSLTFKKINRIIEHLAINAEKKKQEIQFAFMARAMIMAKLPHSKPNELFFERKNGHYTLTMTANRNFGLPYGFVPRMLLAWMTTEAIRTKAPGLGLEKSFNTFLNKLNIRHTGGKQGNAKYVREQLLRLLTCSISCVHYDGKKGWDEDDQYHISHSFKLWWAPIQSNRKGFLKGPKIVLAKDFFEEFVTRPVPIDFKALGFLRKSPLQIRH